MCFLLPTVLSIILRRLLIYGVAARQCAKNRLPPVAAGRIQRNRAGVSWHTTLLAKSSVLYLCEGEGDRGNRYISCSGDETQPNKGWQMMQTAPVCQSFALCGAKVYPPRRSGRSLFLCAFSSLTGSAFEQIGFLANFHQPVLLVVGQFAVIDLVLLAKQHHQLFGLAALDLGDFL